MLSALTKASESMLASGASKERAGLSLWMVDKSKPSKAGLRLLIPGDGVATRLGDVDALSEPELSMESSLSVADSQGSGRSALLNAPGMR
jgi:hypothetical protein